MLHDKFGSIFIKFFEHLGGSEQDFNSYKSYPFLIDDIQRRIW